MSKTFATSVLNQKRGASRPNTPRPIVSKIVAKFQTTIPPEIRKIYNLQEGDLVHWSFDPRTAQLLLSPKRAQSLTPKVEAETIAIQAELAEEEQVPALAGTR